MRNTYLSASAPNKIFPTKMPNIKIVCDAFAKWARSQTKSHVVWIVSVKILLSNICDGQSAEHLSVTLSEQRNSIFGPKKMMLIWCQATGNLSRKINPKMIICHFPHWPIAFWIGSDAGNFPLLSAACPLVPFDSMSTDVATISAVQR